MLCIVNAVLPDNSHIPEINIYFSHHLHTANFVHKFNSHTKQLPDPDYIGLTVVIIKFLLLV